MTSRFVYTALAIISAMCVSNLSDSLCYVVVCCFPSRSPPLRRPPQSILVDTAYSRQRVDAFQHFALKTFPHYATLFENYFIRNKTKWCAGESLTIADFFLFGTQHTHINNTHVGADRCHLIHLRCCVLRIVSADPSCVFVIVSPLPSLPSCLSLQRCLTSLS